MEAKANNSTPVEDVIAHELKSLSENQKEEVLGIIRRIKGPIAKKHDITELKGLGKELWSGVDAQKYVDGLRDEWG